MRRACRITGVVSVVPISRGGVLPVCPQGRGAGESKIPCTPRRERPRRPGGRRSPQVQMPPIGVCWLQNSQKESNKGNNVPVGECFVHRLRSTPGVASLQTACGRAVFFVPRQRHDCKGRPVRDVLRSRPGRLDFRVDLAQYDDTEHASMSCRVDWGEGRCALTMCSTALPVGRVRCTHEHF